MVLREGEDYANVSYPNLPHSPWPPFRHLCDSLGPEVLEILYDVVGCPHGPCEQATAISAGTQTRLRFQMEKAWTHG